MMTLPFLTVPFKLISMRLGVFCCYDIVKVVIKKAVA